MGTWTVRAGERIFFVKATNQGFRADCFNHFITIGDSFSVICGSMTFRFQEFMDQRQVTKI